MVLLGGMPSSYTSSMRVLVSMFLIPYALVGKCIQVHDAKWLLRKAFHYDETYFSRINAYRNCMTKFGYHYFKKKRGLTLIDEGVSHIPFILGMPYEDIDRFVNIFKDDLKHTLILFIESPPMETLIQRIITRGHKRVKSSREAETFVNRNITIASDYKKVLQNHALDVLYI